jgi:hypothetical protein
MSSANPPRQFPCPEAMREIVRSLDEFNELIHENVLIEWYEDCHAVRRKFDGAYCPYAPGEIEGQALVEDAASLLNRELRDARDPSRYDSFHMVAGWPSNVRGVLQQLADKFREVIEGWGWYHIDGEGRLVIDSEWAHERGRGVRPLTIRRDDLRCLESLLEILLGIRQLFQTALPVVSPAVRPVTPVPETSRSQTEDPPTSGRQPRLIAYPREYPPFVSLDGHPYPVPLSIALYIEALIPLNGDQLAFSQVVAAHPEIQGAILSRVLKQCPERIAELIEHRKGSPGRLRVELLA